MSAAADTLRRGWCPGALRPMQSGDGLIVRIKPSCGVLSLDQTQALAALAQEHGNGLIELTSRANIQLRGIRSDALDTLQAALGALGLLDASPEAEARRNIITSPLAGIDPTGADTHAIVVALEQRLASEPDLHPLSDKFGFLVDGGGVLGLSDIEADIAFVAHDAGFSVGLAEECGYRWIGRCAVAEIPDVAISLARGFAASASGVSRMRHLSPDARDALAASLADTGCSPVSATPLSGNDRAHTVGPIHAHGRTIALGVGLPYGATTSEALLDLAQHARSAGALEIRLTPRRALLIPLAGETHTRALLASAVALGFITDPADPRRAIAACPGAPACANGSTPVRADADRFAAAGHAMLAGGTTLHVSGCAKGCACRQPSAITLVADGGRYGLVVNGKAGDTAAGCLTADEATEMLACLARQMTKAGDTSDARNAALAAALKEIAAA